MVKGGESDLFVALARETIEEYVNLGRVKTAPSPIPPEMEMRAGAFVSLHRFGRLRGCIGTIEPCQPNLAMEVIHNAISASTQDPRFEPVTEDELEDLTISVDVLSRPEPVAALDELDPKKYGVIVESGWRKGLLLPDLEGVDTVEEQVGIAMQKAGIRVGEPIQLYRFQVTRHGSH